jgi:DHA1 family bicyclomycin/chloramphenicol resistance-like MFS transporter
MNMKTSGATFAIFLGALAALPPISIDMALPALTKIGSDLGATGGLAGLTLSLFMAGFAISPFFYGPLADRHGRRPLLLIGLVLFSIGGLGRLSHRPLACFSRQGWSRAPEPGLA